MRKKLIPLILILAAAAAAYFIFRGQNNEDGVFRTSGTMEALEAQVESKIAGRLVFIGFREGDEVNAGELVAIIDPAEPEAVVNEARAALDSARRALAAARASRDNAAARRDAAESDVERSKAELSRANAELELSEKELVRAEELFEKGVTSQADLDRAVSARDTSHAGADAAKAALESAKNTAVAAGASVREAESNISTLGAKVKEAESSLGLAEVRLADTKIYSPLNGTVDYRFLEEGETVAPGTPILTIVDTGNVWARIDVDERYIGRIRQGQSADITLDYMPGKVVHGKVFDIGREGGFATERDVTRGRQDIRTFRTRIRVDDPEGVLKPGMTVIVTVPVH